MIWSKEEDDFLISLSGNKVTLEEIYKKYIELFNARSYKAIQYRFYYHLKLKSSSSINHYTTEELNFIKDNIQFYNSGVQFDYDGFINEFNNNFSNKLNKQRLNGLVYSRLGIKLGKCNFTIINKLSAKLNCKYAIGDEILHKGYSYIKISSNGESKWKPKQVYLYENYHNVEIKKNEIIAFLDGNKTNFNIDNLVLLSRNGLGKMIKFNHIKDTEIRKTAYAICKTECMIEELEKEKE